LKCPRDGRPLDAMGPEAVHGHRCGRCSGVLLFERSFMGRSGHPSGHRLASAAGLASLRNLPQGGCTCPRDGAAMLLLVYQEVELDVCPACYSVWVDDGEISKIRAKVRQERVANAADQVGQRIDGVEVTEVVGDGVVDFVLEGLGSILDGISL
jgi:Zn-finger nucleic acid-binding protein